MTGDRLGWRVCLLGGAVFAVCMTGTTLPTPLYPLYQQKFGFSELTVTVVYAVYAFAVIGVLLLAGNASDTVGSDTTGLADLAELLGADWLPAATLTEDGG